MSFTLRECDDDEKKEFIKRQPMSSKMQSVSVCAMSKKA